MSSICQSQIRGQEEEKNDYRLQIEKDGKLVNRLVKKRIQRKRKWKHGKRILKWKIETKEKGKVKKNSRMKRREKERRKLKEKTVHFNFGQSCVFECVRASLRQKHLSIQPRPFSHTRTKRTKNVKNLTFLSGQLIILTISVVIIYLLSKQIVLLVAFVDFD